MSPQSLFGLTQTASTLDPNPHSYLLSLLFMYFMMNDRWGNKDLWLRWWSFPCSRSLTTRYWSLRAVWFATEILGARFRGLWCQAISVLFAYDLLKGLHLQKWKSGGCQSFTSASAFSSILLALFLASVLDPSFYSLILLVVRFSKKINHWACWDRSSILFSNLWDCKTFYSHHPYTQTHTFTHSFKRDLQLHWLFLHTLTIFSLYNARYPLNLLWIWTTVKREFSYHFIQYIQSIFLFFTSHNR